MRAAGAHCLDEGARRLPCASLLLALAVLAVFLCPGLADLLEYRRAAVLSGQWWRLVTGHFTHTSPINLAWNLGAFLALGAVCEAADRARFRLALTVSVVAIPLALVVLSPATAAYRGLSGAASSFFALLVVLAVRRSLRDGRRAVALLVAAAGAAFFLKVGYEALLDRPLFAVDGSGFVPLPVAHLVGAAAGLAAAFVPARLLAARAAQSPDLLRRIATSTSSRRTRASSSRAACSAGPASTADTCPASTSAAMRRA